MKIRKYDGTNWVQQYPEVNVDAIVTTNDPDTATGTASDTFLRGDGSWQTVASSFNGGTITSNLRIESGSFASLILDRGTTGSGSVVQFENNNGIIGGIGAYGNDGLQFRTTDGTQMVIDSSNRVGIGTTAPTEKLTVVGDSTTSENSPVAYIKHNFTGTHGFGLSISRDNSDIAALALGSNSSNHGIVVGNNTNLVLGTISSGVINDVINVKTDSTVDVDGKLTVEQAMTNGGSAFSSPHLALKATNTVDSTGFVGMTMATSTADNYGWSFGAQRTSSGIGDLYWRNHSSTSAGNDRMMLTSAGNLGIGDTNPSEKLTVNGKIRANDKFQHTGTGGYYLYNSSMDFRGAFYDNGTTTSIYGDGNGSTAVININSDKVGIGTASPASKLEVDGDIQLVRTKNIIFGETVGGGARARIFSTQNEFSSDYNGIGFSIANNGRTSPSMYLRSTGNLGIGTTNPAERLDVSGNIIVSGDNRYMTFGTPGAGTTTGARFFSIEGNTDTQGEGSGRIFFTEHNSSTAAMDNYGMSLGYRGGASSIEGASGNTWSGLSQIGNGQWGMWGHNNSASGALVMSGDRAATYIDFHDNELRNIGNANIFDTYRRDTIDSASEDFNDYTTSGTYAVNNWSQSGDVVANGPTNTAAGNAYGWGMLRVTNFQSSTGNASGYVVQEYIPHVSDTHYVRFQWNGTWTSWRAAWGSDNDGAGSGVDADLLDGQHGSYYTGYTDTAISNLVASAPGTLDTLNELAAAINDDASFASTITTQLTGKAKRIDLTNQVQLSSYRKSVIALCNVDNSVISRNSWSGGTIFFHRTNGLNAPVTLQVTMEKRYNATGANYTALVMSGNSFGDNIQYVTFDYNGNTYGGIEFFFTAAEHAQVYFIGESNFDIFGLDYYNTQAPSVLNSEVNNSISTSNMVAETDFFFNNQKIFHSGNDGSTSGLDAQYFNGIPHTSFLRSDANDTATGALTLSSSQNHYSGHHYFDPHDANGNHYPHYLNGSNNNGAQVNMRVYDSSGNPSVFFIDGDSDDMTWRGHKIWTAGNDGNGSGLSADNLRGYVPQESASANSIAKRDGNGDLKASKFIDGSNTSYYLDPASTSVLYNIDIQNATTFRNDVTLDHDGTGTAADSHGIVFTARAATVDFTKELLMDDEGDLVFNGNALATEAYVTANAGGGGVTSIKNFSGPYVNTNGFTAKQLPLSKTLSTGDRIGLSVIVGTTSSYGTRTQQTVWLEVGTSSHAVLFAYYDNSTSTMRLYSAEVYISSGNLYIDDAVAWTDGAFGHSGSSTSAIYVMDVLEYA